MGRTRKIELDKKSIDDTVKVLKQMQNDINKIPNDIEQILTEAVNYCKEQSGNFRADTYWEKTATGYRIVQEGEGALYVEFGTGTRGMESPHPQHNVFLLDAYNSGSTVFTTKDGRTGWFYPMGEDRTEWRFTEGQPARKQMYLTAVWLQQRLHTQVRLSLAKAVNRW